MTSPRKPRVCKDGIDLFSIASCAFKASSCGVVCAFPDHLFSTDPMDCRRKVVFLQVVHSNQDGTSARANECH